MKVARCEDPKDPKNKKKRTEFVRVLCVLRNIYEEVAEPARWTENISEDFAQKMLASGKLRRQDLALLWPWSWATHKLNELWVDAKPKVLDAAKFGDSYIDPSEEPEALSVDELEATCHLFAALDPGGDAFRYPNRDENWRTNIPSISLRKLGDRAQQLEDTARWFRDRVNPLEPPDPKLFASLVIDRTPRPPDPNAPVVPPWPEATPTEALKKT